MEDLQVIIYIVFGIIYIIFGALKKRRKDQADKTPPLFDEEEMTASRPAKQVPRQRTLQEYEEEHRAEPGSLEELLERYDQAAQRAKGRAAEKVETVQEQVDDEFIPVAPRQPVIRNMEAEALEQMQQTERLKALQEEMPAKARVELLKQQPQVEIKPRRTKEKAVFNPYDKKKKETPILDQVRQMARSRKGMQKAIILSEILNRKHF